MAAEWIFLRGLGREQGHWEDFPKVFESHIAGARARCLDLPGSGERFAEKSPLTIRATLEKLRESAPPGPKYLFAISLGGMVAVEWAKRYPEEILGVVLVNSSLKTFSGIAKRLSWRAWPWLFTTLATADAGAREKRILERTAPSVSVTSERVRARVGLFHAHPMSRGNLARQLWAASRYQPTVKAPGVPILVLYSERDRLVDPRCSTRIAQVWKTAVHAHPTAGHDLPLEDPEWCCRAVNEWLSHQARSSDQASRDSTRSDGGSGS